MVGTLVAEDTNFCIKLCQYQMGMTPSASGPCNLYWQKVLALLDTEISGFCNQSKYIQNNESCFWESRDVTAFSTCPACFVLSLVNTRAVDDLVCFTDPLAIEGG